MGSDSVDVAVIGAGIVGCVTAREVLARHPDATVVVLDRDTVGSGATRRSAGLHFPRGATPEVRRMTRYSEDYYAVLLAAEPQLPIFPLGMTVVAAPDRAGEVEECYLPDAGLRRASGGAATSSDGSLEWTVDGAQYADVYELTQHLAAALRPQVEVREGVRVTDLQVDDHGVDIRLGSGAALRARRVVLASGPWLADPAWRDLVAPLGVRVKKVVAMHVRRPPGPDARALVFHDEDAFLLPMHRRGYWLFSYTCTEWDVDPDDLRGGISDRELAQARACLARRAPEFVPHCAGGRMFCDAYGPAGEPVVAALDPAGRVVFAGACNGSGYRLAPAIAARTVDLLRIQSLARSSA